MPQRKFLPSEGPPTEVDSMFERNEQNNENQGSISSEDDSARGKINVNRKRLRKVERS